MSTPPSKLAVAIVIPVYNEELVLSELFVRLTAVFASQPNFEWSAVLVDDGSADRSAIIIAKQHALDSRFKLVELSPNFGFQAALAAGFSPAKRARAVPQSGGGF